MLTEKHVQIIRTALEEWTAERYTWGNFARDITLRAVMSNSREAVFWCIFGQVCKSGQFDVGDAAFNEIADVLDHVSGLSYNMDTTAVNDDLGYVEARLLLRMAIGEVCIP